MTNPAEQSFRAVDLRAEEARYSATSQADFTEAKEAIVEALVRLTECHCTGEGVDGEVIFGVRPSSKLVSGFLLPRFDGSGTEDETTDIHIATMGMDLQVATAASGNVVVRPSISIYLRELPTWAEISDPRHDMMPQVQLSRETRIAVEQRARDIIQEGIRELPPLEEEAEDQEERAGNAIANAEAAHERADVSDELRSEGGESAEERGATLASAEATARADRAVRAHRQTSEHRAGGRQQRMAAIAAIRREAFDRAFRELGVRWTPVASGVAQPLTSDDLVQERATQLVETGPEETQDQVEAASEDQAQENPELGAAPGSGAITALRPDAGRLDDHFAAPQPIPQKWRRFHLELGEFSFDLGDSIARQAVPGEFEHRFAEALDRTVQAWVASDAGQLNAYRPNERVLPSQFADEASWNRFLDGLRQRRSPTSADVKPDLSGVCLVVDLDPDFVDPTRANVRIAIQNDASMPSGRDASAYEHAIFQVGIEASLPSDLHRPLQLDRIEPSYRFRHWLEYPAMGLNCGVTKLSNHAGRIGLGTTWAPRYFQPRIDPRSIDGVPTSYAELAMPTTDVQRLFALPDAYDNWITAHSTIDGSLGTSESERATHQRDIDAYRRESRYIRAGVELLREAQGAARTLSASPPQDPAARAALSLRAAPWVAWLRTNETFAAYGGIQYTDWRLFQLAFLLAHVPTLASRSEAYGDRFDAFRDELSASLLYFATGGGKSEAFFGLLIFNLFFDRLRGKHRGVTALIRYPLRLLTLQQARRLTRILVHAEIVRLRRQIAGWPFELGFWVGSGNTPNRVQQGFGAVPTVTAAVHADDAMLLQPPDGDSEQAAKARRRGAKYKETLEAYDKLRKCPCCGAETGMRKYPSQHGRIGIVCFNDQTCEWNRANPSSPHRVPLPFILTDDTIYQRAPSIVLGTVDKLALIGQHDRTVNAVAGMFGCARYMDPVSQHLFMPRGARALAKAEDEGWIRIRPAFANGTEVFRDPFPSLVIQDEGHLLDESLGTFSGLFETTLDAILTRLADGFLRGRVATWLPAESDTPKPRLAKVIAATATISDPDRQLRVLYQRESLRFPCPGPTLYDSFYAEPRVPLRPERLAYFNGLPEHVRPEAAAPRMRTYVSLMTNGRSHTMTTSAVVSAYHLAITKLRALLEGGRLHDAVAQIVGALSPADTLTRLRADSLIELRDTARGAEIIASLLDLSRISLTYVTNKKGGDQIIETTKAQVERDQSSSGIVDLPFTTELISGGVTIAEIQDVMARAEGGAPPGQPFQPLGEALRNIVATSAISHGVAHVAERRLVVMTPFINRTGFEWLRAIFQAAPAHTQKIVVLRDSGQHAADISIHHASWLRSLAVCVFDYNLAHDRVSGRPLPVETFHAKIVLADDRLVASTEVV